MSLHTTNIQNNPSDETFGLGPLVVRFLITGEHSTGSVAAFEVLVPAAQRLAAPAHSHDQYEETIYGLAGVLTWTVNGILSTSGRDRRSVFRAVLFTDSTTTAAGREGALRDHAGRDRTAVIS